MVENSDFSSLKVKYQTYFVPYVEIEKKKIYLSSGTSVLELPEGFFVKSADAASYVEEKTAMLQKKQLASLSESLSKCSKISLTLPVDFDLTYGPWSDQKLLSKWIKQQDIRSGSILSIDTEFDTQKETVRCLQICHRVDNSERPGVLVIRMDEYKKDSDNILSSLLETQKFPKFMVDASQDKKYLAKLGLELAHVIDLQDVMMKMGARRQMGKSRMLELCGLVSAVTEEPENESWKRDGELDKRQILYAAADVFDIWRLGVFLSAF